MGDNMAWLDNFNIITSIILAVCYTYQFFYIFYAIIKKPVQFPNVTPKNRYAVLLSARNEESVIGHLLESIKNNDYPSELVDVFVVADNCTDQTASISREKGAIVYERFDKEKIGKGYALDYLLKKIRKKYGRNYYNGFFVFDADNLLESNYISEMNKCFSAGHRIITSYRNSKNYGTNWISSGYALWFMREARYLNNPRFLLGTSCAVSGTGFLVHRDIFMNQGGWKHYLLTEDIEFSIDNVIKGERIAYCHNAMLYDEQPTTLAQSWRQRLRWSKGFLQVVKKYGKRLFRSLLHRREFSYFDMMMTIAPALFLTVANFLVNLGAFIFALFIDKYLAIGVLYGIYIPLLRAYLMLFIVGVITGITEWKKIHTSTGRKILSFFTFPFFMLTYIPIAVQSLFSKTEWKPIKHSVSVSIDQVKKPPH